MSRVIPQTRRHGEVFELVHNEQVYAETIGYLPDFVTLIEILVNAAKTASELEALARDAAILISFAMQFGAPLADLRAAVSRGEGGAPASLVGAVLDAATAFLARPA